MHPTGAHLGPTPMKLCLPSSPKFMILVMNKYDVGVEGRITSPRYYPMDSVQVGKAEFFNESKKVLNIGGQIGHLWKY